MTTRTGQLSDALKLPNGARFYKCALQVNPFEYLGRHKRQSTFKSEADYSSAVVEACKKNDIEVIAITDHYRVGTSKTLMDMAKSAGIIVFPGFEATTKDGVHILCLFDPSRDVESLRTFIGDCGVHDEKEESPTGRHDTLELLEESHKKKWGAVCIAAHVAGQGGLLYTLTGQARINAWTSSYLLACSLPGPAAEAPEGMRAILRNKDPEYKRERPVAILNAQDVCDPTDLEKPSSSCWIKMSRASVEGLRQAFLDPQSRIRLSSDPPPEHHAEFVALTWQSGFLDGSAIHFNENLNVLVGGRGTGKSTVVESLRYVLGLTPFGEDAEKAHESIVKNVLCSGTRISLLMRSHRPNLQDYYIERTIPNPAVVRDMEGKVLNLAPTDLVPRIEIFGQHEIAELTKSPEKLTLLLERFVQRDLSLAHRKSEVQRQLEQSRTKILEVEKDVAQIEERIASLPALEEMLKRFQDAGMEDRLKEQSLLVREEQVLKTSAARLEPFRGILGNLRGTLPIDTAFVSPNALNDLPGKAILAKVEAILIQLNKELVAAAEKMHNAIDEADRGLTIVKSQWEERKKEVQSAYEGILRELQKQKSEGYGEEFIRLRRQIEELRPLREQLTVLTESRKETENRRRSLIAEWGDARTEEFQQLAAAAKKVNKELFGRVRVRVDFEGDREPLFQLLRESVGGRLAEALEVLAGVDQLSPQEFARACTDGPDQLISKYKLSATAAERIARASHEVCMQVEELDLSPTAEIELNIAAQGQDAQWKALKDLSTGQKATAVLLLLLLESDAPLVVDQPEDDLDNRFITEGIVPKMREEKRRRQFVFTTHNANVPVLGDAELIVGLTAIGEAGQEGKGRIPPEQMGSIDAQPVCELVEEVLEGGRAAFEMRRMKYGF